MGASSQPNGALFWAPEERRPERAGKPAGDESGTSASFVATVPAPNKKRTRLRHH